MDRAGVEDRVYRLHYNESQKRNDTFALVRASAMHVMHAQAGACTHHIFVGDCAVVRGWRIGTALEQTAAGLQLQTLPGWMRQ